MRILLLHNHYRQQGGEDAVFSAESRLLKRHGHEVTRYTQDNRRLTALSGITIAARAVWSLRSQRELSAAIRRWDPQVAHFHNTFPLISPSAYYSCRRNGLAVVQTLHNFRLLCPAATFYRRGRTCTACLGRAVAWPGAVHGCYRGSRTQTAWVALLPAVHRLLRTFRDQVDMYVAPSEFAREMFVRAGLPAAKIRVKPNFVDPDPGVHSGAGEYGIFVGRLSHQKGLPLLLAAWRELRQVPLKIVGAGPLSGAIGDFERKHPDVPLQALGWCPREETVSLIRGARFLLFPSGGYETFGRTLIEAFACGVPVIASGQGAVAEMVRHADNGLCFTPGSKEDLAAKVRWLWEHEAEARRMGRRARAEYEERYTAEANYHRLMEIYEQALGLSGRGS